MPAVTCPACRARTRVPAWMAGTIVRCPGCAKRLRLAERTPKPLAAFAAADDDTPPSLPPIITIPPPWVGSIDRPYSPPPDRDDDRPGDDGGGLVVTGYVCALISLALFPPAFGLAGGVCGFLNCQRGRDRAGVTLILMSAVCASIGMYLGYIASMSPWQRFWWVLSR